MKKRIFIIVAFILLISVFIYNLSVKDNKVYINTNNEIDTSKGIAVYLEQDDGNYSKTTSIPSKNSGYYFNAEKSICEGTAELSWNNSAWGPELTNVNKENTKCYLYFDQACTGACTTILNDKIIAARRDFSVTLEKNTTGTIYQTTDDEGSSYYYAGAPDDNYVTFGGFCWRIIRINGDGSLRLIYDGTTCHANGTSTTDSIAVTNTAYNLDADRSEYVGWSYTSGEQHGNSTPSNARSQTENWYNTNLASYADYIADGKYCNDRNVKSGYTWEATPAYTFYYAAYGRLRTNQNPTLSCTTASDVFTVKIGLITADEVAYAGGVYDTVNQSYYLYNGNYYWTMTPHIWYIANSQAGMYIETPSGELDPNNGVIYNYGLRPVINIRSDVTITGNGTIDSPYQIQ